MKDKSNRKKRYILAGIFLGIAALLGIERCVNDDPESEQRIEQKTAIRHHHNLLHRKSLLL